MKLRCFKVTFTRMHICDFQIEAKDGIEARQVVSTLLGDLHLDDLDGITRHRVHDKILNVMEATND